MKKAEVRKQADRVIKYLSKEYLALPLTVQRFAEAHILYGVPYTCTLTSGEKKEKIFIER